MNTNIITVPEKKFALESFDYFCGERCAMRNPEFKGAFMVADALDVDGYCIVGNDLEELIVEAYDFILSLW